MAGFAPRVDLRASYTRLSKIDQPKLSFGGMDFELFPQILDQYALRAGVSIPVTDYFLTVLPSYQGARRSAAVAKFQTEAERAAVALRAKEAFYDYAQARAALVVAEDSVRLLSQYLPDLEALVAAGVATKADLLQTRAQIAEATTRRIEAEGAVEVTAATLRRMLRLEPGQAINLGEGVLDPVDVPVPPERDVLARAMAQRPELKALRGLVWANQAFVSARRGGRWPQLAIVGNLDYANPNARAIPQTEKFSHSWSAGVVLSWSPNDFVAADVRVDDARLELTRARTDLAALEDQIVVEVSPGRDQPAHRPRVDPRQRRGGRLGAGGLASPQGSARRR